MDIKQITELLNALLGVSEIKPEDPVCAIAYLEIEDMPLISRKVRIYGEFTFVTDTQPSYDVCLEPLEIEQDLNPSDDPSMWMFCIRPDSQEQVLCNDLDGSMITIAEGEAAIQKLAWVISYCVRVPK